MVPRSRLLPPSTPPVLRRHVVATRRAALRGARLLATATQRKVVDVAGASDAKGMSEEGNILLVEKDLQFKPLERPASAEIMLNFLVHQNATKSSLRGYIFATYHIEIPFSKPTHCGLDLNG